jgi:hypothetical protein
MAWQSISMDFVDGLPLSGGKNYIMVVIDHFSKYAHVVESPDLTRFQGHLSSTRH